VEIAKNYGIPLVVRSSWTDEAGTKIVSPAPKPRSLQGLEISKAIDAVVFDGNQAKVALLRVPDRPGIAARLFGEIARQQVDVDLIIQSIHEGNSNDIAFTVVKGVLDKAQAVVEAISPTFRSTPPRDEEAEVIVEKQIAKISVSGAGMIGRPGVAAKIFRTLADNDINIEMISTSELKVSCVIEEYSGEKAIKALCEAFEIEESTEEHSFLTGENQPAVRSVALDMNMAQVAIRQVSDRPGMAAEIFTVLAEQNISVDMIIQSQRCRILNGKPTRDIAFTVAQTEAENARRVLEILSQETGSGEVIVDTEVAKVSIVGAGMLGQPGVAADFFEALAQEEINILMIATSEIKVSCVVPKGQGVRALQAVHSVFGLAGCQQMEVPA
jgi:aspartate kinase